MATVQVQSAPDVPSYMRCVPGSTNIPVAEFPFKQSKVTVDPAKIAASVIETFNQALHMNDFKSVASLFVEDGYWRDHLALSWEFRTVQGSSLIHDFLKRCSKSKDGFRLQEIDVDNSTSIRAPKIVPVDADGKVLGIQFFVKCQTALGKGVGLTHLVEHNGKWKIFFLYTRLDELRGHEEAINYGRPRGVQHGGRPGRQTWKARRALEVEFKTGNDPVVVIIGKLCFKLSPQTSCHDLILFTRCRTSGLDSRSTIEDAWR